MLLSPQELLRQFRVAKRVHVVRVPKVMGGLPWVAQ